MGDWEDEDFTGDYQRLGRIYDSATGPVDPELIRQAQIGYYACITHLDHQIGRLIQALVEYKLMDNTIILFTSDHGEELCDHHLFRKSRPYEGSCRIPMLLSGPERLIHAAPGTVCHSVAELRDVMPTLLDAAGAPIPETVDGKSMIPDSDGTLPVIRQWLHGEHEAGVNSNHFIVTEHDKYVWYSQTGREQYFNLDEDRRRYAVSGTDRAAARIADRGAEGAGGRLFRWSETDRREGDHGTASVRVWNHLTRRRSRFKVSSQSAPVRRSAQSPVRPTARCPRVFLLHSASAGRQKELCPDRRR